MSYKKTYNFITSNDKSQSESQSELNEITTLYQICQFSSNGYVWVRKLMVDKNGYMKHTSKQYDLQKINCFIKQMPSNKIYIYPTSTLDMVPLPTGGEILIAQSSILNSDTQYTGYATV
jgi:hypothetical protein